MGEREKAIGDAVTALGVGPKYQCDDCERIFTDADETDGEALDEGFRFYIHHLYERVAPGEEMPAGQCNHCGALVHIVKE